MLRSLRTGPVLVVLAAVAMFSVGGAAFSAANTVPTSSAGEDSGTISRYTITATPAHFMGIMESGRTIADAVEAGDIIVEGDIAAAER
jgi:hypothetical protein